MPHPCHIRDTSATDTPFVLALDVVRTDEVTIDPIGDRAIAFLCRVEVDQLVGGASTGAATEVTVFVERCDSLVGDLEALEAEHGDRWPSAPQGDHGD